MATVINRAAGTIAEKYGQAVEKVSPHITTGPVQKTWRARILTNRVMSGLEKEGPLLPNASKTLSKVLDPVGTLTDIGQSIVGIKPGPSTLVTRLNRESQISRGEYPLNGSTSMFGTTRQTDVSQAAMVPVINYYQSKAKWDGLLQGESLVNNQVIIFNTCVSPYQYLKLQNRPTELDFRGETTWAAIKSMGRNLPMYHFTGAEDIIQFNISWYCNDPENPAEVINKCRLLESWTKANGYQNAPPVLQIQWGTSDIFYGNYYILTSATYTLSNFASGCRLRNRKPEEKIYLQNKGLYPYTATQELVFKRVLDHNPVWDEVYNMPFRTYDNKIGKRVNETNGITM